LKVSHNIEIRAIRLGAKIRRRGARDPSRRKAFFLRDKFVLSFLWGEFVVLHLGRKGRRK